MSIANEDQSARWNSGEDGAHWVSEKERYDGMLAPFLQIVLEAAQLKTGEELLDVGCGSGATTLAAARLIAPGNATGLDLSAPMLERARADAEKARIDNVSFERGDVQVLHFDKTFDVVISRFGVMFFEDPTAAFENIRSACKTDGRLIFVCWQPLLENEWLLVPAGALAEHVALPEPGPVDGPGMFALSDPERVRRLLADTGWHNVTVTSRHAPLLFAGGGSVQDGLDFLMTGSMGRTMLEGVDPAIVERALQAVREALEPRADAEGVNLDAAVWLVQASA